MNSPIANNDIMNSPTVTIVEEKTQRKCGNCGEFGHNKRKCLYSPRVKEEVEKKESNRKCGKCGEFGHNARTCPTLEQYCDIEDPSITTRLEPIDDNSLEQCETSVEEINGTIFSFSDDGNIIETKIMWCSE